MTMLVVAPAELVTGMVERGESLKTLCDISKLSAHDMAEMHIARQEFPFSFDSELEVALHKSPLQILVEDKSAENMYNRVNERIDTLKLRRMSEESKTSVYTLYSVDETLWVAALQRQPCGKFDPQKHLLSQNHQFFDDMIKHSLHQHTFEMVCSTNLFTYYLQSIPKLAA